MVVKVMLKIQAGWCTSKINLKGLSLKDSDNISWIKCVNCKKLGHLKCISNVKEEQLSQIILPTLAAIVKFIKMQCSLLTRDTLLATR